MKKKLRADAYSTALNKLNDEGDNNWDALARA
jgi:hypothetical protein